MADGLEHEVTMPIPNWQALCAFQDRERILAGIPTSRDAKDPPEHRRAHSL